MSSSDHKDVWAHSGIDTEIELLQTGNLEFQMLRCHELFIRNIYELTEANRIQTN